jgi:hypothetical protein
MKRRPLLGVRGPPGDGVIRFQAADGNLLYAIATDGKLMALDHRPQGFPCGG